jgi:hypothetical protein
MKKEKRSETNEKLLLIYPYVWPFTVGLKTIHSTPIPNWEIGSGSISQWIFRATLYVVYNFPFALRFVELYMTEHGCGTVFFFRRPSLPAFLWFTVMGFQLPGNGMCVWPCVRTFLVSNMNACGYSRLVSSTNACRCGPSLGLLGPRMGRWACNSVGIYEWTDL